MSAGLIPSGVVGENLSHVSLLVADGFLAFFGVPQLLGMRLYETPISALSSYSLFPCLHITFHMSLCSCLCVSSTLIIRTSLTEFRA